jgi:hypothetical protein
MFGAVYIPAVYLPMLSVWIGLECVRSRRWRLGLAWCVSVALMVVLSAVKLAPQLEFSGSNPRPRKVADRGIAPAGVLAMFGERRQDLLYWGMRDIDAIGQARDRGLPNGNRPTLDEATARPIHDRLRAAGAVDAWHEYGAYFTHIGLILAGIGLITSWRRHWPLYAAGAAAFVVVLSSSSPLDLWSLLQELPLYVSLTVPSRFLAGVILVLAVMSAHGLAWLVDRVHGRGWLRGLWGYGVPIVVFGQLAALGWSLWGDIFVYPREALPHHESFAIRYPAVTTYYPGTYSHTFPLIAANSGSVEGYENVAVRRGHIKVYGQRGYRGEVHLASGDEIVVRRWTMGAVDVAVTTRKPDRLILNQNFSRGWRATVTGASGTRSQRATASNEGLVSVALFEGDREVTVFYWPDSLTMGAVLSAIGWLASGLFCWGWIRQRRR